MVTSCLRALRPILFGGVAILSINAAAAAAQDAQLSLQEQPLSDALRNVAQKTGESILFTPESVDGLRAPAISGQMNAQQAVTMLTRGTDLEVVSDGANGLIVRRPFMRRAVEQVPSTVGGGSAPVESVVVSGFKASLEKALDMKRNALGSSDSILAEDIAKFPDLNLSESIQRIPGVALSRDEGEGREIQVRGLNSTFTRVRINGMEAMSTVGGEDSQGGTNRGRAFDFNVFASDLFSGITVHKSASAGIEEGSLGATVDLTTAHPFDHQGFTFALSGQAGYADQGGQFNPRFTTLVSDTFMGGKLGVLFSAAFQSRNTLQLGFDTTRFENDNTQQVAGHTPPLVAGCATVAGAQFNCTATQRFGSVAYNGTPLPGTLSPQTFVAAGGGLPNRQTTGAAVGGLPNNYDVVNEAFGPRFPRYDYIPNHEIRMGFTNSIQFQPDDATLVTLDLLAADFSVVRQEEYLEANSLSLNQNATNSAPAGTPALLAPTLGRGAINILSYSLNPLTNNLDAITASNVGLRSEHRIDHLDTRFGQATLDVSHTFSEDFKVHGLAGWSESHHNNPIQTTLTMDYNCTAATATGGNAANCAGGVAGGAGSVAQPFSYDFTQSNKTPGLNFGNVDPTSTNGWFLSQIRERTAGVFNSFRTVTLDATYTPLSWLTLQGGVDIRNYGNRQSMTSRSNGANTSLDSYIPSSIENTPLSQYTQLVTLPGDYPAGVATRYLVPDLNKANQLFNIWDQTVFPAVLSSSAGACTTAPGCGAFLQGPAAFGSSNGTVREGDTGFWFEAGWDALFYGVPFRGNIGVRYVETETDAQGIAFNTTTKTFQQTEVKNTYHDVLPSLNAVLEPVDNFLIRLNASYVMTRPGLTALLPGVSITQSGANPVSVSTGNPNLAPYRAKTADLSFEWYYHKGALLSFAFFYKHLDVIEVSQNLFGPFATNPLGIPSSTLLSFCGGSFTPTCNDTNTNTTYTTTTTQKGGPLYGTEIDWQQPFDFLPQPFDNFGFLGNVSFIQARQNYVLVPATATTAAITTQGDLQGLSRTTYNATFYYDDSIFQARLSGAFRSKFLVTPGPTSGLSANDSQYQASTFNLDASSSYKIDDNFTVDIQAINLTDQALFQYLDTVGHRPLVYYTTGREYFMGVRYNY
ncbi:MAG TPA: TonB-dependent receptor [Rhizomicrobium sp.]|nr:TonB-dependent receptor [Rhizomicrobium sp.]